MLVCCDLVESKLIPVNLNFRDSSDQIKVDKCELESSSMDGPPVVNLDLPQINCFQQTTETIN